MKTKITLLLTFFITISLASAFILPLGEKSKAPEKSPVIGINGDLEKLTFIHYAKPANPGKPTKTKEPACYDLMGYKWKTNLPLNWQINPTNSNPPIDFVLNTITKSAETWDKETSANLFLIPTQNNFATYGIQDFQNSVDFGELQNNEIIAVTSIWFTRRGKAIVEFDMRFNTYYDWGNANLNNSLMDLENIATHELGHAIGLNDIYQDICSSVTMYGYSSQGDTSKRILETPDILGLQEMYGL